MLHRILHKIGDDAASGLAGAKFDLTVTTGADGFNDLTGITSLDGTAVPAAKVLRDGVIYLMRDGVAYDVLGTRVQ